MKTEQPSLQQLYEAIIRLEAKLDNHITEEEAYRPKVDDLLELHTRGKGVWWFLKVSAAIVAGFWVLVEWATKHIKLP